MAASLFHTKGSVLACEIGMIIFRFITCRHTRDLTYNYLFFTASTTPGFRAMLGEDGYGYVG